MSSSCLGHPTTWVKGQKCPSSFHIKAAQWLVRTSHCTFPKITSSSSCKRNDFFFFREFFFLASFSHCLLFFFLVVVASSSPVFEVSEYSSSCSACSSLPLDIVYCFVFWFTLVLLVLCFVHCCVYYSSSLPCLSAPYGFFL